MNPYGGLPTQQQAAEQQQKAQQQEEMRQELLKKILSPEALTRLGTLAVAKPEKVPARFKFLAPVHTLVARLAHASFSSFSSFSFFVAVHQARQLEEMVLMMAQKGQVKEQITDGQFKQMLEGMSGSDNQPKMTYTRRGGFDDDDDDSAFALIDLVSPIAQRPAKTRSRARGFVVRSGRSARRPVSLQECWHARALMSMEPCGQWVERVYTPDTADAAVTGEGSKCLAAGTCLPCGKFRHACIVTARL